MFPLLRDDFVVGWTNIEKEDYVGMSFGYSPGQPAVGTTNGAGAHNVQIFVLSPDRVVLHALFGFWHPEDLARELRFAKVLARLWDDPEHSRAAKDDLFRRLQLAELRRQPVETFARSRWQNFDRTTESRRQSKGPRDTFFADDGSLAQGATATTAAMTTQPTTEAMCEEVPANGALPQLKPLNVLVHERMAERPFVAWDEFDVAAFVDYGREFYDNNTNVGRRGKVFRRAKVLREKRARAARIAAEREARKKKRSKKKRS